MGKRRDLPPFWPDASETWKAWLTAAYWRAEIELSTVATDDDRFERREEAEAELRAMTEPPVLDALQANSVMVQTLLGQRTDAMFLAREQGATWDQIGRALGITGQSARTQYQQAIEREGLGVPGLNEPARRRAVLGEE